jgi:hypothetical protein
MLGYSHRYCHDHTVRVLLAATALGAVQRRVELRRRMYRTHSLQHSEPTLKDDA